ncbi:unnamed protein product [Protopolystoma xenopodis]|uniref:Uncharacterized protein n=1 Tax=Protopolystoma xenopodis TaxID=117903 RepID=A0A448XJ98_9PLAT|nr:unnamed protein product [Protopolystoma xenopodis]
MASEFYFFLEQIEACNYADRPEYDLLRSLIKQVMIRHEIRADDPFDWELEQPNNPEQPNSITGRTGQGKIVGKVSVFVIGRQIKKGEDSVGQM